MKKSFLKNKKGFTLAEMLVVMFIFSILSVGLANIFVKYLQGERSSFAKQKIVSDLRYSLEMMSREVRLNEVDYRSTGYYSGFISSPTNELALVDSEGTQILFALSGSDCTNNDNCYLYVRKSGVNYRITPDDIAVRNLEFYITPSEDPFTLQSGGTFLSDDQPRVLISITQDYIGDGADSVDELTMQTMASSKIYIR